MSFSFPGNVSQLCLSALYSVIRIMIIRCSTEEGRSATPFHPYDFSGIFLQVLRKQFFQKIFST